MKYILSCLLVCLPAAARASVCDVVLNPKVFEDEALRAGQHLDFLKWQAEQPNPVYRQSREWFESLAEVRTSLGLMASAHETLSAELDKRRRARANKMGEAQEIWRNFSASMESLKTVEHAIKSLPAESARRALRDDTSRVDLVRDYSTKDSAALIAASKACRAIQVLIMSHAGPGNPLRHNFDCYNFIRGHVPEWPSEARMHNEDVRLALIASVLGRDWNIEQSSIGREAQAIATMQMRIEDVRRRMQRAEDLTSRP